MRIHDHVRVVDAAVTTAVVIILATAATVVVTAVVVAAAAATVVVSAMVLVTVVPVTVTAVMTALLPVSRSPGRRTAEHRGQRLQPIRHILQGSVIALPQRVDVPGEVHHLQALVLV
jgi:hypothetical protein